VVRDRTGVRIAAVARSQHLVHAAFLSRALVIRAVVAIVAQVDVVTVHQVRLVHFVVAIIVQAIAGLH